MVLLGRRPHMEASAQCTLGTAALIGDRPELLIRPGPALLDMRDRRAITERGPGKLPLGQPRRLTVSGQLRTQHPAHLRKLFGLTGHLWHAPLVAIALTASA